MTVAISFDGHSLESERPIGIDVATREFIRAHFRFSKQEIFYCVCPDNDAFEIFKKYGHNEDVEVERCLSINQNDAIGLKETNCLLRYDPGIVRNAWSRRYHGQRLYSICGVAHSSASANIMETVGNYMSSPLQSWDALICPSKAIRSSIKSIITAWEHNYTERFGSEPKCPLDLPVIPLGVDTEKIGKLSSKINRKSQRELMGISKDEIVILYVGRLNYIAKANPLPLLIATEEVAKTSTHPIRILFYGYFNDETNENAFEQAINQFSKNVKVTVVRHGDTRFPNGVWATGDIFCSLSDNIQESFGLTPVEAMAAGMPVIVSDWNGYRDTVQNGIEGITIPTYMPPAGAGEDLAYRYFSGQFNYGDYLGATTQSIAVDLPNLVSAITTFCENTELRITMGEAGRKRASQSFDWSKIITAYDHLWGELNARRKTGTELMPKVNENSFHPSRQDPFLMFNEFSTSSLSFKGRISVIVENWPEAFKRISLKMGFIIPSTLMEMDKIPELIAYLEDKPNSTLEKLAIALEITNHSRYLMTIGWLLKLGICQYFPPNQKF